jgi:hypothetical protein
MVMVSKSKGRHMAKMSLQVIAKLRREEPLSPSSRMSSMMESISSLGNTRNDMQRVGEWFVNVWYGDSWSF